MTYSPIMHRMHDQSLLNVIELIEMYGWRTNPELPVGMGPADAFTQRGDRKYWLQHKTRTPSQKDSAAVSISYQHLQDYINLQERHNVPVVITTDDMMCDVIDFVKVNVVDIRQGYYLLDTYENERTHAARQPCRYTVQEFFR